MRTLTLFIALALLAYADSLPIRLPAATQVTTAAASTLTAETVFVVDSDIELVVTSSLTGLVKVTKEEGPLRIRGKFIDTPDKVETRTFKGKHIYTVEPVASGKCELLIIPVGLKSEAEIIRRPLSVDANTAPQPPPIPPGPRPDPEPKPVTSFRVIIGYESGATYAKDVVNVLYGKAVEEWLTANCTGGKAGWRRRDQSLDGDNDPAMAALWKAVKDASPTAPFFAVEVNGKVEIIPLETTPAAMVAKLQTYRGAK